MKTTTRVKKINGHEYLYEISYYYDKETRRTRQKSRYLGKYIDGKPVRVREKAKSPEKVYTYGEFIPYLTAIRTLHLEDLLLSHLTEHETRICLTLAIAALICPEAIHNPGTWFEGSILTRVFPGLKVTSRAVIKILKKLGETVIPMEICRVAATKGEGAHSRVYDLMIPQWRSLATELQTENKFHFYDQISLYYDNEQGIPIAYMPHLKNLTATQLIKTSVAGMHLFRYRQTSFISGRKFNSAMNIYGLSFSGTPFIIQIGAENDIVKEEVRRHRTELMHPKNLKIFHGETLFVIPISIPMESMQMHGFISYCPRRDEEERTEYGEDLNLIVESLNKSPIYRWADPAETICDVAGRYEPFIQWKVEENRLQVSIKQKAVAKHLRDAGISVYLHAGDDFQWEQCLEWTSQQAEDESFFSTLSRNFQIYPHTIDADTIRQGTYMIIFLSLMMRRWVERQFEMSGLLSVSSLPKILIELSRIRLIGLGNDRTIVTGFSSKQRDILESLKWQVDYLSG